MKRTKKTVEKRTYSLKGAIPKFVSLVSRGANFTPFTQLRFNEAEKFGENVEINRIVFAKTTFDTQEKVETYLTENAYESFSVVEDGDTWVVAGEEADKFEDIQPIEYEDGVLYFIGKLKADISEDAPAAEVVTVEEFAAKKGDEAKEDPAEEKTETPEDEAKEDKAEADATKNKKKAKLADAEINDGSPAKIQPDQGKKLKKLKPETMSEEAKPSSEEATSEEVGSKFAADKETKEEVEGTKTFSAEDMATFLVEFTALKTEIKELQEKLVKYEEKEQVVVDEPEIIIQNSQAVNTDEISKEEIKEKDEKAEKFSQNRQNDLFGLRG